MKNVLNGNLKVWHLLVAGVLLMLTMGGTIALADTEAITALWGAGTFYMGADADTDSQDINAGQNYLVSEVAFTVPEGQKADVSAVWSAFIQPNTTQLNSYCFASFYLDNNSGDSNLLKPGQYQLIGDGSGAAGQQVPSGITLSANGWKKNIKPGPHSIRVYMTASHGGCYVNQRSLVVTVNMR